MAYDVVNKKQVAGDWCCGIGGDVVGLEIKLKNQDQLLNKIDDVRYDIRRAGSLAGAAVAAVAGAVATLGLAEMFRVIKGRT